MSIFVLDLSDVKCPMNLVLLKKAVHDGAFSNGGRIVVQEETPRKNIANYLTLKGFEFTLVEEYIEVWRKNLDI